MTEHNPPTVSNEPCHVTPERIPRRTSLRHQPTRPVERHRHPSPVTMLCVLAARLLQHVQPWAANHLHTRRRVTCRVTFGDTLRWAQEQRHPVPATTTRIRAIGDTGIRLPGSVLNQPHRPTTHRTHVHETGDQHRLPRWHRATIPWTPHRDITQAQPLRQLVVRSPHATSQPLRQTSDDRLHVVPVVRVRHVRVNPHGTFTSRNVMSPPFRITRRFLNRYTSPRNCAPSGPFNASPAHQ